MNWMFRAVRVLFVVLGTLESISNLIYLTRSDGLNLARKQHRELPARVSDRQIQIKIVFMFVFGVIMLAAGIYSYAANVSNTLLFILVSSVFAIYTLAEAIYYRYWKTFGAAAFAVALFLAALFG